MEVPSSFECIRTNPTFAFLQGDALRGCEAINSRSVRLIHSDLPFNTGKVQENKAAQVPTGWAYLDAFENYAQWLEPLVVQLKRILTDDGLLALQLDDREHITLRNVCDRVFGAQNYKGTIIWHPETGGVARRWWAIKHQYIVLYGTGKAEPIFRLEAVPTVPRKSAPKKVINAAGQERIYDGDKKLNSVWNINWSTTDPSRCGYPNQKPLTLAQNLIAVHTNPGDWVLDPCCGSGTTGFAANGLGRNALVIDQNPQAAKAIESRFLARASE